MSLNPAGDEESSPHPLRRDHTGGRPKASRKEFDALVKAAWAAGWWCVRRSNNYIACQRRPGDPWITVPSTPSKQGTFSRVRRQFQKQRLDV